MANSIVDISMRKSTFRIHYGQAIKYVKYHYEKRFSLNNNTVEQTLNWHRDLINDAANVFFSQLHGYFCWWTGCRKYLWMENVHFDFVICSEMISTWLMWITIKRNMDHFSFVLLFIRLVPNKKKLILTIVFCHWITIHYILCWNNQGDVCTWLQLTIKAHWLVFYIFLLSFLVKNSKY